jgi:hypothetical protein
LQCAAEASSQRELSGEIRQLAQVETCDAFVAVGVVVVGSRMMPFADFEERIVERRKIARQQQ